MKKDVKIPFEKSPVSAYCAIPDSLGKQPALIVIHEIWGINAHIKDIVNRIQAQGFIALAPDLLSETGITEKISPKLLQEMHNPATKDEAQKKMREALAPMQMPEFAEKTRAKLQACFSYLKNEEHCNGNIGVIGFCFGGTYCFALASAQPQLKAAVPFYGHAPEPEKIKSIHCPILAFYGEKDTNLVDHLPELTEEMAAYHKQFESVVYPDCGHAFFNDTNPNMYNKEAADDAWERTLAFLKDNL